MTQFNVGDRVRVVSDAVGEPLNSEAVVTATRPERGADCCVLIDGDRSPHPSGEYSVHFWQLAPLTPPASDVWAADKVKQVTKPMHAEPVAPRVAA